MAMKTNINKPQQILLFEILAKIKVIVTFENMKGTILRMKKVSNVEIIANSLRSAAR